MKRVLLVALVALAVVALAGSAQAVPLTACNMVKASEYAKVLGDAVTMTPGEGTHSCNVTIGGAPVVATTWIIPNLTPYNAGYGVYIKGMYSRAARGKGMRLQMVPALGPMGAVLVFPNGAVTTYAQKGTWFVAFQGEKGVTKAQMLALASLVYRRL